jgi:hypothetical protein
MVQGVVFHDYGDEMLLRLLILAFLLYPSFSTLPSLPFLLYPCQVYSYYKGKGIYCIVLSRALNLVFVRLVFSFQETIQLKRPSLAPPFLPLEPSASSSSSPPFSSAASTSPSFEPSRARRPRSRTSSSLAVSPSEPTPSPSSLPAYTVAFAYQHRYHFVV